MKYCGGRLLLRRRSCRRPVLLCSILVVYLVQRRRVVYCISVSMLYFVCTIALQLYHTTCNCHFQSCRSNHIVQFSHSYPARRLTATRLHTCLASLLK